MYISVAGLPISKLGKSGKAFLRAFAKYQGRSVVDPYAVYSAQIAQIMLGRSPTRTVTAVRRSEHDEDESHNGIMGTFRFDRKGDICPNQTISFYRLVGKEGSTTRWCRTTSAASTRRQAGLG